MVAAASCRRPFTIVFVRVRPWFVCPITNSRILTCCGNAGVWLYYCGAQARCPALASKALAVLEQLPDRLALPAIVDPAQITQPDQMALALQLAPVLTAWAESVRAHALEMVQNGQEIPGFELRHRSGQRVIKDLVAVWDILHAEFSIPLQEFLAACSISVTGLESAVKSVQAKGKGAEAIRKMNQLLTAEGLCVSGAEVSYLAKEKK